MWWRIGLSWAPAGREVGKDTEGLECSVNREALSCCLVGKTREENIRELSCVWWLLRELQCGSEMSLRSNLLLDLHFLGIWHPRQGCVDDSRRLRASCNGLSRDFHWQLQILALLGCRLGRASSDVVQSCVVNTSAGKEYLVFARILAWI